MEPLWQVITVFLAVITTATAVGTPGGCEEEVPTKKILCHINNAVHPGTNPCLCTHMVVHDPGLLNQVEKFKLKNKRLKILTKENNANVHPHRGLDGFYLKLDKPPTKGRLNDAVKALAISLDNAQSSKRARAKYEGLSAGDSAGDGLEIFMELPSDPQKLAKHYDLKALTKYINYFVVPSENLTDSTEQGLAYHPSRLMGIDDILNADSLVDLLSGLGAEHEKLIVALPAYVLKFRLKSPKKNMPRDPVMALPIKISQAQFCKMMEEGGWTLEREEDMTAPYAYKGTDWMAFDDTTSTSIKAKYILLRELAGLSVVSSEHDDWTHSCSARPLLDTIHYTFTNLARKSRAAQLLSLQDQIHNSLLPFGADVHLSPYRIVRVVDRAGAVHVVRKEAKTEFQCSRQGFFTHPSGCNRFYRCVKFNQYSSDFTVFEYDCPAGLAFDEKYEVCVWPGSLRDASPCKGSSEIAPVPRNRFACNAEGYFADPENCRWFFACLDHQRDGTTPPTAYEFRCPFGLVFDNSRLVCDWPWKVPGCGSGHVGVISTASLYPGDILEGRLRPAYADVSDAQVSGGRISGGPGGLVLGTTLLSGIADQNAGTYATGVDASRGSYLRGGPTYSLGLGSSNLGAVDQNGQYVEDNSGAYVHDPTGDTGGEYRHEGEYSSRYSGDEAVGKLPSQNIVGTVVYDSNNLAPGSVVSSGTYAHDGRGDTGGAYVHDGFVKTVPVLSRGRLAQGISLTGAQREGLYVPRGNVLTGGYGAYVHDSRGDTSGPYVYDSGLKTVTESRGGQRIYAAGAVPGTVVGLAGIKTVPQSTYVDTSGGFVHDLRGVTGSGTLGPQGIAVGTKTLLGPKLKTSADINLINSGVYVHDSSGDYAVPYIHDNLGDYDSTYYGGKYKVGSGTTLKTNLYGVPGVGVSYGDGAYIHDTRGDYGGGYYQPGFKTYVPASTYGIKLNQADLYQPSAPVVHPYGATRLSAIQPGVKISPITVSSVPSVPLKSVQYIQPAVRPVVSVSTPTPQLVGYQYKTGVSPSAAGSSFPVGKIQPVILGTPSLSSQTVRPLTNFPSVVRPVGVAVPGAPAVSYVQQPYIKTQTIRPITVSSTPVVPLSPVQYAQTHFVSTPAPPVVSYSHVPLASAVSVVQPALGGQTVHPAAGLVSPVVSYGQKGAVSTHVPSVVRPLGVAVPEAPAVSYVQQPYIKTQTVRPITVSGTPIVPLSPVQYGQKQFDSTPAPPVVSYSHVPLAPAVSVAQPVLGTQTVHPVSGLASPVLHYGQKAVVSTHVPSVVRPVGVAVPGAPAVSYVQQPYIKTQTVRPITVSSTPVVPLSPVQYAQTHFVSTPTPPVVSYSHVPLAPAVSVAQPAFGTQTVRPVAGLVSPVVPYGEKSAVSTHVPSIVRPVGVAVPGAPAVSYVQQPYIKTQTVRPITVSSTPVVPLSPVQYAQTHFVSTPTPPVVSYSHVPLAPAVSVAQPAFGTQTVHPAAGLVSPVVSYGQKGAVSTHIPSIVRPVGVAVPGAPAVSYVQQPYLKTQTVRPITVSGTPVVPLSPVQYAQKQYFSTPAPSVVSYSNIPLAPAVSVAQPAFGTQTVRPVAGLASPILHYGQKSVVSTHIPSVVSPVGVAVSGAPAVSYVQQPYIKTQTVRPISVPSTPVVPLSPVKYAQTQFVSTPAPPVVSYSHVPLAPAVSVAQPAFGTQTVRPVAGLVSPVVPYGQKAVVSTHVPSVVRPVGVAVPGAPVVSYVQQPYIKTQTVRPITVSSTPVVPLSPVQYAQTQFVSTQAPPVVSYSHGPSIPAVSVAQPVLGTQTVRPVVGLVSPVVPYGQKSVVSTHVPSVVRPVGVAVQGAPAVSYVQQPYIKTQTVRPITVSSTPVVPLSPVQYAQRQFVSTPAPSVVSYSQVPLSPAISVAQPAFGTQTVRPVAGLLSPVLPYGQKAVVSTHVPSVVRPVGVAVPGVPAVSYAQQPYIKTQTVRPITVSSTPVVPLSPVQYAQRQFVSTPAPSVVSYSQVPLAPAVSVAQPAFGTQTVRPVAGLVGPVLPYGQKAVVSTHVPSVVRPVGVAVPGVPAVSYVQQPYIKTQTVRPITVSSTPVVPLSPVQYAQSQFVSTPAPSVVSYSQVPLAPAVSVAQPVLGTQTVRPVAGLVSPVVPYGQKSIVSTHAPSVVRPLGVAVPGAPAVSYVQQPYIKTQTVRPITVASTPVVPLSPVQYAQKQYVSTPAPPVVSYSHVPLAPAVSVAQPAFGTQTIRPGAGLFSPVVPYGQKTVVSTHVPSVVRPVGVAVPEAPAVSYVQQPYIKTQTVRPITVASTPLVPLSPVQYAQKQFVGIPGSRLPSYSFKYQDPFVSSYAQPFVTAQTDRPLTVTSTPVPLGAVSYAPRIISPSQQAEQQNVYCASCSVAQTVSPITVSSTPAPPVVSYSYKQQVPVASVASIETAQPAIHTQTLRPVTISSTTSTPFISYQQPLIKTQTVRPIVVSSSPAVPLSPVQYVPNAYVSTPSPPVVSYTYQKPVYKTQPIQPIGFSTPDPFIDDSKIGVQSETVAPQTVQYVTGKALPSYQQSLGYAYPKPVNLFETPEKRVSFRPDGQPVVLTQTGTLVGQTNLLSGSTPATPVVGYSYSQPVLQTKTLVTSAPVVPLNPVQYVRPVQPKPVFPYTFERQPLQTVSTSAPIGFQQPELKTPEIPVRPLVVTTPAPALVSYKQPFIKTQKISPPTFTSTTAAPLDTVQFVRPVEPKLSYTYSKPQPFTVSTAAPSVVQYQEPFIKTQTLSPVTVTSTPAVPLSPVQYGQPAVSFSYVKPLPDVVNTIKLPISNYPQTFIKTQTIKPIASVVTPAPATVTYSQEPLIKTNIVSQAPSVVSYQPVVHKTVSPVTVTSTTPAVPLQEVHYIKSEEPKTILSYNLIKEQPDVTLTSQVPVVQQKAFVTSRPEKPPVGTYFEEYFEANNYQKPIIAVHDSGIVNAPLSPVVVPEVSTVRPAIKLPLGLDTVQTVPLGVEEEGLNVQFDVQKVGLPLVTSSTPQQVVEVTTASPVGHKVRFQDGSSRGGYYVRKQKVKVPLGTTSENYPAFYTSTVKPVYSSTVDLTSPTFYSTTVTPSTTALDDYAVDVEGDVDDSSLLGQVSGDFGEIIHAGGQGIIREGVSSTTVSSLKDGEAVVGVIKKEREPLTGRKKTKVVVVSRLSDFNPLLVGKLGAVCSCKSDSQTLDLRKNSETQGELFIPDPSREYLPTSSAPLPQELTSFDYNDVNPSVVEIKPVQRTQNVLTTSPATPLTVVTVDSETTPRTSRRITANGGRLLESQIDCQRPGLFRHPHLCNKFYSCDWDQKKKRFTVNIFNCPIHLAFDSKLGACNWPSKGPACSDNNLLV
ncbi:uncharacterized protein isoform X2 [Rhodnius prolixus]